jgi:hypothetical protein
MERFKLQSEKINKNTKIYVLKKPPSESLIIVIKRLLKNNHFTKRNATIQSPLMVTPTRYELVNVDSQLSTRHFLIYILQIYTLF